MWDRFVANCDQPESLLAAWTHQDVRWAERWRKDGAIELITDGHADAFQGSCFDQVLALTAEPPTEQALPASEIAETQYGQLIAAAMERVSRESPWSVLWLHSDFLTRCWDAPRHWDEEDPNAAPIREPDEAIDESAPPLADEAIDTMRGPFHEISPPQLQWSDRDDPDLVTDWMNTYACQIRLVDLLLELLVEETASIQPTLLVVGTSGFRLGQGGWIGHQVGPLRSPDLRLPLLVSRGGPLRVPQLTSSDQLGQLLAQLHDQETPPCGVDQWCRSQTSHHRIEITSTRASFAVRTSDWFYVEDADQSEHLYLKPDDIDDFNDVARLRPDVVESLRERMK